MSVTLTVTRGYTAVAGTPITVADFNLGFLPSVVLVGDILEPGGVLSTDGVAGAWFTGASTGSGGNYILTLTPAPTSMPNGMWVGFLANHANAGAATLNVNGLGAKAIVTQAGVALTGSEIVIGQPVWVQYYLTGDHWRMYSVGSKPEAATFSQDVGAANAYAATYAGLPATALVQLVGVPLYFLAGNANTGASTFAVNGLAATPILKGGGTALSAGDIPTDSIVGVMYDGSDFKLIGFVAAPALPAVGATGTHVRPYSITVDAQGRVTAVTASASNIYTSAETALPAAGAATAFTHSLGRTPSWVRVVLVAQTSSESSYTAGQEVDLDGFTYADIDLPAFHKTANSTTVIVVRAAGASDALLTIRNQTNGASITPTDVAKWKVKVYAS